MANARKSAKQTKRSSGRLRQQAEALADISGAVVSPLIRQKDPGLYRNSWKVTEKAGQFKKTRELATGEKANKFVSSVIALKQLYFGLGFEVLGASATSATGKKTQKWLDNLALLGINLRKLSDDIWMEFLTQDNAIVMWRSGPSVPIVLDTEMCEYSEVLGVKSLTVNLPGGVTLTKEQEAALGPDWVKAWTKGGPVLVDPAKGDFFKVLTRSKLGNGLSAPRIAQIFDLLATSEVLEIADFCGAWEAKDLIQHVKKGHEIKQGPRAGEPTHFLTPKQQKTINSALALKLGSKRVVSNFDVDIAWKYLDPKFFDPERYTTTKQALANWAGAPAMMYEKLAVPDTALDSFRVEGLAMRELVGGLMEEVLNDENFSKPPGKTPIRVGYNPGAFFSTKMLLQWVQTGVSSGLMPPQMGREFMGIDEDTANQMMADALLARENYTPVFEAKQGIVANSGGRPSASAGAETPPPDPNAPPPGTNPAPPGK